jgi:general secretion pathway protein B
LMDVRLAPPRRRAQQQVGQHGQIREQHRTQYPCPDGQAPAQERAVRDTSTVATAPAAAAAVVQPSIAPAATPAAVASAASDVPNSVGAPVDDSSSDAGLPTLQDLVASGIALPPLQLNLHAYDPNPASRYVLLNTTRLREGDFTRDGIKVERITATGVVLDMRGRRFVLRAGG